MSTTPAPALADALALPLALLEDQQHDAETMRDSPYVPADVRARAAEKSASYGAARAALRGTPLPDSSVDDAIEYLQFERTDAEGADAVALDAAISILTDGAAS